jgi:hypothetical protein
MLMSKFLTTSIDSIDRIREEVRCLLLTTDALPESTVHLYGMHDVSNPEELAHLILMRQSEIQEKKEKWRPRAQNVSAQSEWKEISGGGGGVYRIGDFFIVKPEDEGIYCLNNPKNLATPFNDDQHRLRDYVPAYQQVEREFLSSQVAEVVGLGYITPHVDVIIITNELFFGDDKEKLCTVQEYIIDGMSLFEWQRQNDGTQIDMRNFEDVNILMWLIYNTDGHANNFFVCPKEEGVVTIKEIDNGMAFPEKNSHFYNILSLRREAKQPLSEYGRDLILGLPIAEIVREMRNLELDNCVGAFLERVDVLQELCQRGTVTIEEVNIRMQLLGLKGRREALCQAEYEILQTKLYSALLEAA